MRLVKMLCDFKYEGKLIFEKNQVYGFKTLQYLKNENDYPGFAEYLESQGMEGAIMYRDVHYKVPPSLYVFVDSER